ncbi:MAG: GNAT family N-acetyltransferase [Deltaproteobacteria bacterium]|nr:GNAT family N-acetyltransferase [Deltaproteobacteria bacterium]
MTDDAVPSGLEVTVHDSVGAVAPGPWDACVARVDGGSPFLRHGFLSALEDSRSVGGATGWTPRYLVARAGLERRVVGLAPAFIKTHSMGEFVYDWAWADAAQRAGLRYYPKLVLAAPFSPVTSRRLLTAPDLSAPARDAVRRALAVAAIELARASRCSGVHALFCLEDEVALLGELGFCHRLGAQFHWENAGYSDFEAFIARFDSKRRNQIRRERRRVREAGVEIRSYLGAAVEDRFVRTAHAFYGATVDRYVWGRRYLNERFFELLWQRMRPYIHLTLAWQGDAVVGGALDLQEDDRRWGRYWGALADIDSLHFEVCAYAPIEDAIRTGLARFEAGAGGEHKLGRGFVPSATHSAHLIFDGRFHDTIADFCAREATHLRERMAEAEREVFVR